MRTLKSQGLSDDELTEIGRVYQTVMGEDSIADILQMECVDDEVTISPVEDANLANPWLIKEQIVEFMKYRAPYELLKDTGLISNLIKEKENIEESDKNQGLINDKENYYVDENEMMQQAYDIYKMLADYQKLGATEDDVNNIVNNLNSYEQQYKEIHTAIVKDLYNTQGITTLKRNSYSCTCDTYYDNSEEDQNLATLDDIDSLATSLSSAISSFETAKTSLGESFSPYSSSMYDIQYWTQNYSTVKSKLDTCNNAFENMIQADCDLDNATSYMDEDAADGYSDISESISSIKADYSEAYNQYLKTDESNSDLAVKNMSIIERISGNQANLNAINPDKHILSTSGKSVSQNIKDIYSQITSDRATIAGYLEALSDVNGELDILKTCINDYKASFSVWNGSANDIATDLAETDKDFISNGYVDPMKSLNDPIAAVEALQIRITAMIDLYNSILNAIDGMKYGSENLTDICDYSDAKDAAGINKSNILMDNVSLDSYVSSSFIFKKYNKKNLTVTISDSNNPDLNDNPKPGLYKWMIQNGWEKINSGNIICSQCGKSFDPNKAYGDLTNERIEKLQQTDKTFDVNICPSCQYENRKDILKCDDEDKTNESKDIVGSSQSDNDIIEKYEEYSSDFPSCFDGDSMNLGNSLGGIVDIVKNLISFIDGGAENLRDGLYSSMYVHEMFSYDSLENENKYNSVKDELQNKSMSYSTASAKVKNGTIDASSQNSLTLNPISKDNNFAYLSEIEYILYGENNDDNVESAYAAIYGLRYLLNLPTGFMNYWKIPSKVVSDEINGKAVAYETLSTAISTATYGIVPAALIKTVFILLDVAVETYTDIEYLQSGIPVKFIKPQYDKNWGSIERTIDTEDGLYLQYSDYLFLFLTIAFQNKDLQQSLYLRIGDVIQANMRYLIGDDKNTYKLGNSIMYFNLKTSIRVSPLMLALPLASGYDNNPAENTDWCTYDISLTRGY